MKDAFTTFTVLKASFMALGPAGTGGGSRSVSSS